MRWYGRLRRQGEIGYVRRRGRAASSSTVTAFVAEPQGRGPRVAVSVSSEVGGAVVRNLVKRRIKGALDGLPPPGPPLRLLFVAKPAAASASFSRLAADVAAVLRRAGEAVRTVVAGLIGAYQRLLSPFLGGRCRFHPSCSQYAREAVLKHGVFRGLVLSAGRLARCHPWNPGGVDLVP